MPALRRSATRACVVLRRRRHGNSVGGHATKCLFLFSVFSTVCHFICCVAPQRHAENQVFQSREKRGVGEAESNEGKKGE